MSDREPMELTPRLGRWRPASSVSMCRAGDTLVFVLPGHEADTDGDLAVCQTESGRFYDNR